MGNSNLFVFKNGWTSSQQNRISHTRQPTASGKNRPQSSNHMNYRKKHIVSKQSDSINRVWKYDQHGKEIKAGVGSLGSASYGGFVSSATVHQVALSRTNSQQKYLAQNQSHNFLTHSGSKVGLQQQQNFMLGQRASAH